MHRRAATAAFASTVPTGSTSPARLARPVAMTALIALPRRARLAVLVVLTGLAGVAMLAGCSPAGGAPRTESQLVGRWHGQIASRTTRSPEARFDDFDLTVLPGGRVQMIGWVDGSLIDRAGQRIAHPPARVLRADYQPTRTAVAVEILPDARQPDGRVLGAMAVSLELRPDGQLAYHFFGYAMALDHVDRSEASFQVGLLRRADAGPSSRPD